jgi:hypothetical protein
MKRLLLLSCLGLLPATPAFAQSRALVDAEQAYQAVDFPAARALAQKALEAGGNDREETARLYVLLGISAAAQGDAEAAKASFVVALAVEPSLKLDKGLSPKVRDPYLEARGYWSATSGRLALNARPSNDTRHLVIELADPASLVSKTELRLAEPGSSVRPSLLLSAAQVTRYPLPRALEGRAYEYTLRALDRFGNVLAEHGTETDPTLVRAPSAEQDGGSNRDASAAHGRSYLLPATLGVAGLGALTTGIVFHVKREDAAYDWNSPSCEHEGRTRVQQCHEVDERRSSNERLAIGFYAAGGALLTGSLIALVAGRPAANPNLRAGLLGCRLAGTGLSCDGRF